MRLAVGCAVAYGGLYLFEYLCYTSAARERRLKALYATHMAAELRSFARHTCPSKIEDLVTELARQTAIANQHVAATRTRLETELAEGERDLAALHSAATAASEVDCCGFLYCFGAALNFSATDPDADQVRVGRVDTVYGAVLGQVNNGYIFSRKLGRLAPGRGRGGGGGGPHNSFKRKRVPQDRGWAGLAIRPQARRARGPH